MKTVPLAHLVLLLLTTSVIAQVKTETSDPPDISVLEKRWSKETQFRQYREWNPNKNQNPRADTSTTETLPLWNGSEWRTTYVYKFKAKNNGLKTIKTLYWEYQFLDPDTQRVLATHRMVSSKELLPGKTGVFKARTEEPPTTFISAKQLGKKYRDQFTERLIIHRVDYTDGTLWERP